MKYSQDFATEMMHDPILFAKYILGIPRLGVLPTEVVTGDHCFHKDSYWIYYEDTWYDTAVLRKP